MIVGLNISVQALFFDSYNRDGSSNCRNKIFFISASKTSESVEHQP